MAIKAGNIIHDIQGFVVDRIQTGGVSNLNIPLEKIYELGNYQTVATVRDIPDLSFDLDSWDVSTEIEAIMTGADPTTTVAGQAFDFITHSPIDVISPFKAGIGTTQFNVVQGIVIPYLTLESVKYAFAVKTASSQTYTLRGDSIYYVPGSPYYQEFNLVNNTLTYTLAHTALKYVEAGDNIYALSACVRNSTTGAYKRLFEGGTNADGYTSTPTTVTTNSDWFDSGYDKLHVTYGSATVATYPQSSNQGTSVKPAAVKAKDVCVYVSDGAATPTLLRWSGVQSATVDRTVALVADEEFCNHKYVGQDYDTADVTGAIGVKSVDAADLAAKLAQIADVPSNQIVGPFSSIPLELEVQIKDPDSGVVLKTLDVSDARFTIPFVQGKIQTKLEVSFPYTSDGGNLKVYKGLKP